MPFLHLIKLANSFAWLLASTDCKFTSTAAFKDSNLFAKHASSGHTTPVTCTQATCKDTAHVRAIAFPLLFTTSTALTALFFFFLLSYLTLISIYSKNFQRIF